MAHFCAPTIHGVNTVVAAVVELSGSTNLELRFHGDGNYGPDKLTLDVFFPQERLDYVRALAASINVRAVNAHDELVAALETALEYFENRQDADCDQDGFIPNEEMRIASEIGAALAKAGATS